MLFKGQLYITIIFLTKESSAIYSPDVFVNYVKVM